MRDQQYGADQIDKFMKADATRKVFWDVGFFSDPSLENFIALRDLFKHVGRKGEGVADRQKKWAELLDRTIYWMQNDSDAEEMVENLKIFPSAEILAWIEEASAKEMLTNKQRDELFEEYLDVPLPFMSPRGKAYLKARLSLYAAPWRDPQMRGLLISGNVSEFFRRLFSYVFAEDIGGRR